MKRFLIITSSLLILALLAVVVVFWLVSTKLPSTSTPVDGPDKTINEDDFSEANPSLQQPG